MGTSFRCGYGEYADPQNGWVAGYARRGTSPMVQFIDIPSSGIISNLRTPWFTKDLVLLITKPPKGTLYYDMTDNPPVHHIEYPLPTSWPNIITSGDLDPTGSLGDTTNFLYAFRAGTNDPQYNTLILVKTPDKTSIIIWF